MITFHHQILLLVPKPGLWKIRIIGVDNHISSVPLPDLVIIFRELSSASRMRLSDL